jgi:uncharacterized protein (DUF2235 family)
MPDNWCLIFSDGTGQRGVRDDDEGGVNDEGIRTKNTNIFNMYSASYERPYLYAFYDPGLGAPGEKDNSWGRALRNLWAKATGWGISANIADCYEGILINWKPGRRIGLFGFSRGAYTVRCLGGVLKACGIATVDDKGRCISDQGEPGSDPVRRRIAEEAVSIYEVKETARREAEGAAFAARHASSSVMPSVIGVFDTVESIGIPGVYNPWQQRFHDQVLSDRIPLGLHALSIDENRKAFRPVLWDDPSPQASAAGQHVEQVWFPGVHSDIGGGYDEQTLSDLTLDWMLSRLRDAARLHIPLTVAIDDNVLGLQHDERTGFGIFWLPAGRGIRGESVDIDLLCGDIERRFERYAPPYRPPSLRRHPRVRRFYR